MSVTFCIAEGEVLSMTGLMNPRDLPRFQVLGPFVWEGLPEIPLFLFVVKGMHRQVGKKKRRWKYCKPSFYLVTAMQVNGTWQLPLPLETILARLWQRWELEVAHRSF